MDRRGDRITKQYLKKTQRYCHHVLDRNGATAMIHLFATQKHVYPRQTIADWLARRQHDFE